MTGFFHAGYKAVHRACDQCQSQKLLYSLPLSVSLQIKAEVTEDVYTSRKKQHQTMMHYFCALNTLQYKKKISLLEPLLGYMQAQVISDSESCRGQRRNKSPSWRLMYWNPLQALFSSPRKEMEKKNHPSTSVGCPSCALMCWQLALLIAHPLQGSFMRAFTAISGSFSKGWVTISWFIFPQNSDGWIWCNA